MSANINSLFYVGEKPWHKQGKELLSEATAEQAIAAAGLNWTVDKRPVYIQTGGQFVQVPKQYATVRADTNTPLGVVGRIYEVLQNKAAFSFFDAVVGIKEAIYHTAGALGKGEIIWILAKLNGLIRVKGDDIVEKFLLLTNRHDGTGSVVMKFTPVRVVCQNTLNEAINLGGVPARLKHCASIGNRVTEVQETLGIISQKYLVFEQAAQKLATVQLTQEAFTGYLENVGLKPKADDLAKLEGRAKTIAQNLIDEVSALFDKGRGNDLPEVRHTAWTAYNSIVEYVDYLRTSRGADENRTKSLLFGTGATLKQKAWDEALTLSK